MKKFILNPITWLGGLFAIILLYLNMSDENTIQKSTNFIVIDKLQSDGSSKSSGKFYLVLQDKRGIIFDIIVKPSIFSLAHKGKNISLIVSENEIQSEDYKDLMYLFFKVLSITSMIVFLIGGYTTKEIIYDQT